MLATGFIDQGELLSTTYKVELGWGKSETQLSWLSPASTMVLSIASSWRWFKNLSLLALYPLQLSYFRTWVNIEVCGQAGDGITHCTNYMADFNWGEWLEKLRRSRPPGFPVSFSCAKTTCCLCSIASCYKTNTKNMKWQYRTYPTTRQMAPRDLDSLKVS